MDLQKICRSWGHEIADSASFEDRESMAEDPDAWRESIEQMDGWDDIPEHLHGEAIELIIEAMHERAMEYYDE